MEGVQSVAAGATCSLFLKTDGSAFVTGYNVSGELGLGDSDTRFSPVLCIGGIKSISAGPTQNSFFVKQDGTALASGDNMTGVFGDPTQNGSEVPKTLLTGVRTVAQGVRHVLFLRDDGTVWATGSNADGQLGNPTYTSTSGVAIENAKAIAAGNSHSLFLKEDGSVWGAGSNTNGQLGLGQPPLGTDGAYRTPVQIMTDVQAIAAAGDTSLFLKNDGSVWASGDNIQGQMSASLPSRIYTPVQIMSGVKAIATSGPSSFFVKTDDTAWAVGWNVYGQLGTGDKVSPPAPVQVMTDVQAISASQFQTLFLKTDGSAWGVGYCAMGELGIGRGRATPRTVFQLNGTEPTWQEQQFGADAGNPAIAGWDADPDHDGLTNLQERAFRLSPVVADNSVVAFNTGTSGRPNLFETVVTPGQNPVLGAVYVREKPSYSSELTYTVEVAPSPAGPWTPALGAQPVETIDAQWERVYIQESTASDEPTHFIRVRVTTPD
jgi:alpha-tubulin suppressor-like RCC1 family protein